MIHPASTLDLLKLFRKPGGVPSFRIKPHKDEPVDLQRWPNFDLSLTGDFPTGVGDLGAVTGLSVVLPSMEGTLQTLAYDLQGFILYNNYSRYKRVISKLEFENAFQALTSTEKLLSFPIF